MTQSLYEKLSRGSGVTPNHAASAESPRMALLAVLPSKVYRLRDVDVPCYTIGSVAKVLGRSQVTIRSWEQKGWMPLPKVRTAPPRAPTIQGKAIKGRRLYTRAQVEFLINASEQCSIDDPKHANWDQFRELLRSYPTT